jgi:hypothetical protein
MLFPLNSALSDRLPRPLTGLRWTSNLKIKSAKFIKHPLTELLGKTALGAGSFLLELTNPNQ